MNGHIDMQTTYMGMTLRNPIVCSSSPMMEKVENLKRMEDAGAGAVILQSLFEEQIELESTHLHSTLLHGTESFAEALTYFPELPQYKMGPDRYLNHVAAAKKALSIPVIASLNGSSLTGWVRFAREIEQAGADALELNVYYIPTDIDMPATEVEARYVDLVSVLKETIKIPVAVKLGPYFSAPANMVKKLSNAGADAAVVFNRFYQPDFDIATMDVLSNLSLSSPDELRLRLRWVAIMFGRVPIDFGITGGVHSAEDVFKCLMAGARVSMMTSALLMNGIGHIRRTLADMEIWMQEHEYTSVNQMIGAMSQQTSPDPEAFERANYLKVLSTYML